MPLAAKTEVDYSPGMRARHCGPTRKWPDGAKAENYCKHYYSEGAHRLCHKVQGRIDVNYWCKLFEAKSKK